MNSLRRQATTRLVAFLLVVAAASFLRAEAWTKHVIREQTQSMVNTANAVDYDLDGQIDVITSFDNGVWVLRGPKWDAKLLHSFSDSRSRTKPRDNCIHSCLLDVDGDGDLDFCGSNQTVFWLECPGDPFSGKRWTYRTIDDEILGTHCLISADVDGDGRRDLIANSGRTIGKTKFPNSLTWLQIPRDPKSADHWIRHVFGDKDAPGGSHYSGFGDLNQDGRGDICFGAKGGKGFDGGEWFAWWEQPADGQLPWAKHVLSDQQPGATNIHPVDLNGDSILDLFATRGHGKGVLWFEGPSFRIHEVDDNIEGPHCLVTVDLDDDGDIDAATVGKETTGTAVWYENDGTGSFERHIVGRNQGSYDLRAVDMDGDKDLDLLVAGHTSRNIVWYENPLR